MSTETQSATEEALSSELKDRLLVIFDGECGFCNRSIRWLLGRDRMDRLRFVPSSSLLVEEILLRHGIGPARPGAQSGSGPDSLLVLRRIGTPLEEMLVRSNAVLACLRVLPQPWPTVAGSARLLPRPFREMLYRAIARVRYRVGGRYSTCPIPTPKERAHFL